MAKTEVIEIIKKFIRILKDEGIKIKKILLYGSYLDDTNNESSDIDLLIVTEDEPNDNIIGIIWALTTQVSTKIEPYIVSFNKYTMTQNSPLLEKIKATGLEIY